MDIVFILDSSGSVGNHYGQEKNFIKNLAEEFVIRENAVQAGVVSFSHYATININLNQYTTTNTFNHAVENIPFMNGGTAIDLGLQLAKDMMVNAEGGSRDYVQKLLVLLTDGLHNGVNNNLGHIGKHIRKQGISILVIGIGNQVDYSQLVSIAGAKNVYSASSFNELTTRRFVQNAVNASCSFSKYDFINM